MLTFRARFTGPFAIATGSAHGGIDSTVDERDPLPASSLKGLFRAELLELLRLPEQLVLPIFGTPEAAARWRWSTVTWPSVPATALSSRIHVDGSGAAERGFLAIREVLWADTATWQVQPSRRELADDDLDRDRLLLRAAARSITNLGNMRRRGDGRVRIVDVDDNGAETPWTATDTEWLLTLTTQAPS